MAESKRYEVHPGVFVVVNVEGNWMSMPTEKLKELFKTADIFGSLCAPKEQAIQPEEQPPCRP